MKKQLLLLLGLIVTLCACQPKADSLVGEWVADKVNVQFDENHYTPELVKQIGEMEKQNTFTISADSVLVFNGLDNDMQGRVRMDTGGTLFLDGIVFGQWKDGQILTKTSSPLGEIVVTYRKKV